MKPLVSIIIPTYNRAGTVGRTIDSVLRQTYDNFEVIVVEDGSKDDTINLLRRYTDKRMRIVEHEVNKGVTAAKNTGLNNIRGEWFAILDSDDEMTPDALETMMRIPLEKDNTITAVSCNCIDTATNDFSGTGLSSDQYVDFKTLMTACKGEFWGITKTALLLNDRFNERLNGLESTLWYKINDRAKRFYVHKALRVYHTEGDDRVSNVIPSVEKISNHYEVISKETHYLETVKQYLPDTFVLDCVHAIIYLVAARKKKEARVYYDYLKKMTGYGVYKMFSFFALHSNRFLMKMVIRFMLNAKITR